MAPWWLTIKNYLKHKKKKINLEYVIMKLQMESRNRISDKLFIKKHNVNMAEMKGKGKEKV